MSAKEKYEAERRRRLFIPSWSQQFTWLKLSDGGEMFCNVCRQFPAKADRAGAFLKGTQNFRKHAIDAHDKSRNHLVCMVAKRVADNPAAGPLNVWARRATAERQQQVTKLINAALIS
ncbi:hypothetical protein PAMA_015762 [Pampus argenteus]